MRWLPPFIALLAGTVYPLIYLGYRRVLKHRRDEIISLVSKGETFQSYLQVFHVAGRLDSKDEQNTQKVIVGNLFKPLAHPLINQQNFQSGGKNLNDSHDGIRPLFMR